MTVAASQGPSLLESAVVAALVAAGVSLLTLWATGRRARLDRQRKLFAEGFEACVAYREFAYIIRRRRPGDEPAERVRISGKLSEVQRRLASMEAILRVEAPRVGRAYVSLVAATRRVAGPQISKGWDAMPVGEKAVHITDVDFRELVPYEDQYLRAVKGQLGFFPWWGKVAARWLGRQLLGSSEPPQAEH